MQAGATRCSQVQLLGQVKKIEYGGRVSSPQAEGGTDRRRG